MDFSETFQLLFPWPEDVHIYTEVKLDRFLPELWPFVSFSHLINKRSCLSNFYSFQGILMKLFRYCCMAWRCACFIEVMLDWFLPELWPFNNFSAVSLVSATPLAVFSGFWWNLPVIVPMTWRGSYYTEVTLDCFLPDLCPLSVLATLSTEVLASQLLLQFLMKLSRCCCHDLKMIIFYRGHAQLIYTRVMAL